MSNNENLNRSGSQPPMDETGKFNTIDLGGAKKPSPEFGERNFHEERNTKDTGSESFEIDFDFDREYKDRPSYFPVQVNRRKRSAVSAASCTLPLSYASA